MEGFERCLAFEQIYSILLKVTNSGLAAVAAPIGAAGTFVASSCAILTGGASRGLNNAFDLKSRYVFKLRDQHKMMWSAL